MNKFLKTSLALISLSMTANAQDNKLTPEMMWQLGHVNALSASPDHKQILYKVSVTDLITEKSNSKSYLLNPTTGQSTATTILDGKQFIQWDNNGLYASNDGAIFVSKDEGKTWAHFYDGLKDADNIRISPDGKIIAFSKLVQVDTVLGKQKYKFATQSTAQIYTDLNIRHWDTWNDGTANHVFVVHVDATLSSAKDLLKDEPFDCPQKPFGGSEDFIFSPDSKTIIYVSKKKVGKEYAQSTNTDLYAYDIATGTTANWTEGMNGYDLNPAFSPDGTKLAWLSMKTDGFEADKYDLVILDVASKGQIKRNLTSTWDETIDGGFHWSNDGKTIYYNAAIKGTVQLFGIKVPPNLMSRDIINPTQITNGQFDVTGVVAQNNDKELTVTRTDMNHATELYTVDIPKGAMKQVSHANDQTYAKITPSETKLRMVTTTDGKQMGVWVIYPPNFDPSKKYPTLLYCQGGPQGALSQFYSVRWNFALMAAQGYIVVAPNRRGMPGWGVKWNADISKDWGGQPMKDYLAAIDDVAKESYVDKDRLGCVGASYGGYSTFMLAGIHGNRFKTFIAHDGLFDMKSWYGTTEELWFANWDIGGPYWKTPQPKAYTEFNPSNYVDKWNAPIMIIQGGIDFRVPIEQGLEAYQAAQLRGIKSKLLYFPNENHWVLHAHNGLVWQHEFFNWLSETLK